MACASCSPRSPTSALALPALTMIARQVPLLARCSESTTGAARKRLRVNKAAHVTSSSPATSPRSSSPCALAPLATAPNENPGHAASAMGNADTPTGDGRQTGALRRRSGDGRAALGAPEGGVELLLELGELRDRGAIDDVRVVLPARQPVVCLAHRLLFLAGAR